MILKRFPPILLLGLMLLQAAGVADYLHAQSHLNQDRSQRDQGPMHPNGHQDCPTCSALHAPVTPVTSAATAIDWLTHVVQYISLETEEVTLRLIALRLDCRGPPNA